MLLFGPGSLLCNPVWITVSLFVTTADLLLVETAKVRLDRLPQKVGSTPFLGLSRGLDSG